MRLAFISPFHFRFRRGIECSLEALAQALVLEGHTIDFLCWEGPFLDQKILPVNNIRYHIVPARRYFEEYWAIPYYVWWLLRYKPDVVVLSFAAYGEAVSLALVNRIYHPFLIFRVGYPLELVPHQFEAFKTGNLHLRLDEVVVLASYMAPALESFFNRKVTYIPNGVDISYFHPINGVKQVQKRLHHIITVAAIEQRKGFGIVLKALPNLLKILPTLHYTIVGDGPDREWLADLISELNLNEHVTLTGAVDDVRQYLAESELFVLPSYGEGMPGAYLEAMAMGLPSVVSTAPPYNSMSKSEFSVMVNHQDVKAMERTLLSLLQDRERLVTMGLAARKEAEDKYSWEYIASEYQKLFKLHPETKSN